MKNLVKIAIVLLCLSLSFSQTWRGGQRADYTANDICADAYMLHRPGTLFPDKTIEECCADTVFAYGRVCTLIIDSDTLILPVPGTVDTLYFGSDTIYSFDTVLVIGSGLRFTTHKEWVCDTTDLFFIRGGLDDDSLAFLDSVECVFCDSITVVNWFTVETAGDTAYYDVWQFRMGTAKDSCGIIDIGGAHASYTIYADVVIINQYFEVSNTYYGCGFWFYDSINNDYTFIDCKDTLRISQRQGVWVSGCDCPPDTIYDDILDVMFLIDTSGSMTGTITNVIASMDSFVGLINDIDSTARYGFAFYVEDVSYPHGYDLLSYTDFLDSLYVPVVQGGIEYHSLSLLDVVYNMNWRDNARRIMILVTDECFDGDWLRESGRSVIPIETDLTTVADFDFIVDQFDAYGVRLFSIMPTFQTFLPNVCNSDYFDSLAYLTGGGFYASPFNFNAIYTDIATTLGAYDSFAFVYSDCWELRDSVVVPPCSVLVYCSDGSDTVVIYFGSEPQPLPDCAGFVDACDTLCFYFPQGWSVPALAEFGWRMVGDTLICLSTCEIDTLDMSGFTYGTWDVFDFVLYGADTSETLTISLNDTSEITTSGALRIQPTLGLELGSVQSNVRLVNTPPRYTDTLLVIDGEGNIGWTLSDSVGGGNGLTYFTETGWTNGYGGKHGSQLLVVNTENNADIVLSPKGQGAITAHIPDGTATGGNVRGIHAVDLQTDRTANTQVASGPYSVIGGGEGNRASGTRATISGGKSNIATGIFDVVGGGENNQASGGSTGFGHATVSGGLNNTASSSKATVSGGQNNAASGQFSVVSGGVSNTAGQQFSAVSGGQSNTAGARHSSIVGGRDNTIAVASPVTVETYSTILGGRYNSIAAGNIASMVFGWDVDIDQSFKVQFFDADSSGHFVVNYADDSTATAGITCRGGLDTDSLKIGSNTEWLQSIQFVGDTLRITIGTETKSFLAVEE